MSGSEEILRMAKMYRDTLGFSVIPVHQDKKPAVPWFEFQKRKATDEELIKWFLKDENYIGIVTGAISGIDVIDIDSEDGESNLRNIAPIVFQAPGVRTPRGGMHLYHTHKDGVRNKAGVIPGTDLRAEGGFVVAPPSVGMNGQPYRWLAPVESLGEWPDLPESYVEALGRVTISPAVNKEYEMFVQGRRDEDLFHVANALVRSGMPHHEILSTVTHIARGCNPPFSEHEATEKVRSAIDRAIRQERNLAEEVRGYVSKVEGYFLVHEMHRDLGINSVKDKTNASVVLTRLKKEGVIEPYSGKHGCWRKRDLSLEEMDWINSGTNPIDLTLPLGLSELVDVYPNNIIVIAGSPDAGKTAFMLDLVEKNMNKFDIRYFNSEMGEIEMKIRLRNHRNVPLDKWKFHAYPRDNNFSDVIFPEAINIIDFLEISDTFYKVAAEINDIYRKLHGGIAIIGLQKGYGQDLGRGGTFSLEKPRLYLSVDAGKIKITKAKNWKDARRNPNKLEKTFKIEGGADLIETSEWHNPELESGFGRRGANPFEPWNRL